MFCNRFCLFAYPSVGAQLKNYMHVPQQYGRFKLHSIVSTILIFMCRPIAAAQAKSGKNRSKIRGWVVVQSTDNAFTRASKREPTY